MSIISQAQQDRLTAQGCCAEDWSRIHLAPDTDLERIRNVEFLGTVHIGPNSGSVHVDGVDLPCGLYDTVVADCTIGSGVRIARVGSAVARYDIDDGAVIQDVAALTADPDSRFGVGIEVDAVNEGGGRRVTLLPELSAQVAWMQVFRGHSDPLRQAWKTLVAKQVDGVRTGRGRVGSGARILHCGPIRNVHVGPHASLRGVSRLEDGTILSEEEAPAQVGEDVVAREFVIGEGSRVTEGVILERTFVGQACIVGKQFSAENCLFFANCDALHGEALAVFAGPYTVTHHKSTLLVAAAFSFYNAGSGTNQSNHMYKLGPVHQGVFERGSKTGSFSYVLHETHLGAFSVVIGKHYTNIDTPDLPFSYIREKDGHSEILPGKNLFSIGTVRDGEKWPLRDRRTGQAKRDRISFGVFTPYTVEKMRTGRSVLERLHASTPKEKSAVRYGGVTVKRLLFRTCARYYAQAVTRYLNGRVLDRIEATEADSWAGVQDHLRPASGLADPSSWIDVGGLLMPTERLQALERDIEAGALDSLDAVERRLDEIAKLSEQDEWDYVCSAFAADQGFAPHEMTLEQSREVLTAFDTAAGSLHTQLLDDAIRDFDSFSRIGFGLGMSDEERTADFEAVRGTIDTNAVIAKLVADREALSDRSRRLGELLDRF